MEVEGDLTREDTLQEDSAYLNPETAKRPSAWRGNPKNIVLRRAAGFAGAMTPRRLQEIASSYPKLRIALVGDICLDRYFEIDPGLQETSIETNLPVHNVVRMRCQPGGAGTILNNLLALGVGEVYPAAIIGEDGEGYELRKALQRPAGEAGGEGRGHVRMDWVLESRERHTFTYSKPLLMHKNRPPEELNRLDTKNWTPMPPALQEHIVEAVRELSAEVDAMILLDQVDIPETGVVTRRVVEAVREASEKNPRLLILADSRRSLRGFPPVSFKMNAAELGLFFNAAAPLSSEEIKSRALELAQQNGKYVFVTMSERGIVGAHGNQTEVVQTLPVRGEIDIVGAGDAVTANLAASLSAGASLREALEIAQLAASVVIHQLGTTGTANAKQMSELLLNGKE